MASGGTGPGDLALKYWPIIGGLVAWATAWWRMSRAAHKIKAEAEATARGQLESIAKAAVADAITILRDENDRLSCRVDELENEVARVRSLVDTKDAELYLLRGRYRQLLSTMQSYVRLLIANHIDHEKPADVLWEIVDGQVHAQGEKKL